MSNLERLVTYTSFMRMYVTAIALLILIATTLSAATEPSAASLDKRRKQLNDLLSEQWEYTLRSSPEYASILGDKRYNDQVSDNSLAGARRDFEANEKFLRQFEAIDTAGFSDQEKINKALMIRNLRDNITNFEMKENEMPVTQMGGIHLFLGQLPQLLTFTTVKDYDDYLARLRKEPRQLDDTIETMRHGM